MFKTGYDSKPNSQMVKRRDHTPITGKKVKNQVNKITPKSGTTKQERISFLQKRQLQTNQSMQNQSFKQNQSKNNSLYQQLKNQSLINANGKAQTPVTQKDILSKINSKNESRSNPGSYEGNLNAINNTNTSASNSSVIISEVKQMGNKSVLIVKPNQFGINSNQSNDPQLNQSRYEKRRVIQSNDNKQNRFSLNKDNSLLKDTNKDYLKNSKINAFFRVDTNNSQNERNNNNTDREMKMMRKQDNNIGSTVNRSSQAMNGNKFSSSSLSSKIGSNLATKMRSSSTRVTRKEQPSAIMTSITKNHSYTSKGKWKM